VLTGLPPVIDYRARALVLGSMPGTASLQQRQYYAHPRNLFWRITGELLGFGSDWTRVDYPTRTSALRAAGIGLWDVLHACDRRGSLDAAIERDSMAPNDFDALLTAHPDIARVFFNGAKAAQIFHRLVLPVLVARDRITLHRLPSTSPANASISYPVKLAAWRAIIGSA
jgi:TDG/mug DNA glycosylase family protein